MNCMIPILTIRPSLYDRRPIKEHVQSMFHSHGTTGQHHIWFSTHDRSRFRLKSGNLNSDRFGQWCGADRPVQDQFRIRGHAKSPVRHAVHLILIEYKAFIYIIMTKKISKNFKIPKFFEMNFWGQFFEVKIKFFGHNMSHKWDNIQMILEILAFLTHFCSKKP